MKANPQIPDAVRHERDEITKKRLGGRDTNLNLTCQKIFKSSAVRSKTSIVHNRKCNQRMVDDKDNTKTAAARLRHIKKSSGFTSISSDVTWLSIVRKTLSVQQQIIIKIMERVCSYEYEFLPIECSKNQFMYDGNYRTKVNSQ